MTNCLNLFIIWGRRSNMTQIEKVCAEIERLKAIANQTANISTEDYSKGYDEGQIDAFNLLLSFIESLEKEQSTMPNSTELIAKWEETKKMLEEKDFRGDAWRLAYNAFLEGFAKGVKVKEPRDCGKGQMPSPPKAAMPRPPPIIAPALS